MNKNKASIAGLLSILILCGLTAFLYQAPQNITANNLAVSAPLETLPNHNKNNTEKNKRDLSYSHYKTAGALLTKAPPSFTGTDVDGSFQVDQDGQLIIEASNRLVFDYYLAAIGEDNIETIKSRIAFFISQSLQEPASTQAWQLLINYLNYKTALADVPPHDNSVQGMSNSIKQGIHQQQASMGLDASNEFFSFENTYNNYILDTLTINLSQELTDIEKEEQLAQLQHATSPQLLNLIHQSAAPAEVSKKVDILRENNADETAIYKVRADTLGEDAAENLQELDRRRAAWNRRYSDYTSQHDAINNQQTSKLDKQQSIALLKKELFIQSELRRVNALDHINNKKLN